MVRLRSVLCFLLVWSTLINPATLASPRPLPGNSKAGIPAPHASNDEGEVGKGLRFRLGEGVGQPEPRDRVNVVPAARLSDSETEAVLGRLPPVKREETDEQDFALRERSLPPPRAGRTLTALFPPPEQRDHPDRNAPPMPLDVLRYSPEGNVSLAPQLSVTFSQPMVSVATLTELAALDVPVKLAPQPPGKWRWVDTRTLLFEPEGRFPMATDYRVTIPAGARSATGGRLAAAKSWTFTTPPPEMKTTYPEGNSNRRDTLMFVEFDQRIDPAAVLRALKVRADQQEIKVRPATPQEVQSDEAVRKLAAAAVAGRWLAFRAIDPATGKPNTALPAGATVSVSIGPGAPSAEGPRETTTTQSFTFRTYDKLRVDKQSCGWAPDTVLGQGCSAYGSLEISFNNPLDGEAFQQSQVRVEPTIPGMKASVSGNALTIEGVKHWRTVYHVTVDSSIKDAFSQTLGENKTVDFKIGPGRPALFADGKALVVLDPAGPPEYPVYSTNHSALKISLYAVEPKDWDTYLFHRQKRDRTAAGQLLPERPLLGTLILSKTIAVRGAPDEIAETRIDLSPALRNGLGQVLLVVEADSVPKNGVRQSVVSWIERTNLGLDAFVDRTDLVAWATSLKDGSPVANVQMRIEPPATSATTGADGLARLALPSQPNHVTSVLVAQQGSDLAILPETENGNSIESGWHRKEANNSLRWYVFDDRKMYRPGEEVHVKGWIRRVGGGKEGDVGPLDGEAERVAYTLKDSESNEITKGELRINALGGFDTALKLPATMNLGRASLELEAEGGKRSDVERNYTHRFEVEEFRRPEFEVTAQSSEGPHLVGDHAEATVTATYYAGGGLANSEVTWNVSSRPAQFTPPNRADFTFGTWVPWWREESNENESHSEEFNGHTGADGKHHLRIDFDSVDPPRASEIVASARVQDVNRQELAASTTMLVHPAELYVGLKSDRTFVEKGRPLDVKAIVTDLDGKAVANREIKMRSVLLDWVFEKGEWRQKEVNPQDCSIRSGPDAVKCSFQPQDGGTYRITASIRDERERRNESELTLWVAGGKMPAKRDLEQDTVTLIPDRKDYQAGDSAELLVQSPFSPADGVLTLRRSGIVRTQHFHMDGPSYTLRVPVEEAYTPNIHVQVDLNGAAERTGEDGNLDSRLPKRPAYARGELNLSIPPRERKLAVQATPRDKSLQPGSETIVDVDVKDSAGSPVEGSELAVVVVDESILALTSYKLDDPLSVFYTEREADTDDYHLRGNVLLRDPADLAHESDRVGIGVGGGGGGGLSGQQSRLVEIKQLQSMNASVVANSVTVSGSSEPQAINLRENFNALAGFAPAVPTGRDGRAQVKVKLPDNLTRYRVMAVAVAGGKQFGEGESAITARLPLMVRPSAPRFLNFGDRFELPVVVQNQTDAAMDVAVAVRAANADLTDGSGRRVRVPANDRVEVRFPAAAARAGTARFQVAAVSGHRADAAEVSLPVWTPATTEAFATYGEIDDGAITQPIRSPSGVFRQFGGLEITTSSTQLQELTDAVLYLMAYPYECSEQLSSRVLAVAALRDVLTAFQAQGLPSPEEMKAAVARDVQRLRGLQNEDGGFAFWRSGDESWPYLSIHAAHALERAKEKGFDVPAEMLDSSKKYLREIEKQMPAVYHTDARRALIAYSLYVRNRMGDRDAARARKLVAEGGLDNLSLEAAGWLLPVLSGDPNAQGEVEAIRRHLGNRATETAGTAHFVCSYRDGDHLLLNSDRRADAVVLEALIGDQPRNDLIPKLVRGLLDHRLKGRWENTQENVFVLLALDRYFATYEKVTPKFIARAWLGDRFAGEQRYMGRSADRQQVTVPMRHLTAAAGTQDLILSKDGPGRLYYRIGMRYAPSSLKLDAADNGFSVQRIYEAVDGPADVRRDADGTWHVKAGAKVRVRLTMVAPGRRYHVALVDPMPAGLEAMNPALAVTGEIPQDPKDNADRPVWWWQRSWFEHQNLRDERVEAFTSLLWDGVYDYSYVARATTPGVFIVPPPKAEEMYHPETFGRGATDRVIVE